MFMGHDGFVWFVGVVEDRNDPDQLGRVRVRCLGTHTPNLTSLPTSDLPWAHVMHPTTDPAMHGMGNSPSFLVEGTWVVGFFRDAKEKQQPTIIGTLPGIPKNPADFTKGFNDPRHKESTQVNDQNVKQYAVGEKNPEEYNEYGPYPLGALKDTKDEKKGRFSRFSGHTKGESDTSRLGRDSTAEDHGAVVRRRKLRRTKIITAAKPNLKSVSNDLKEDDTGPTWDEPHPRGLEKTADPYLSGKYPYNHVYESESGHLMEIDDTPGGERLHREHREGTFEEIHPDGSKMVKVVGDNYEIVAGKSNVLITGDVNLTIEGTKRELIKGDYIQEIEGNHIQRIHKNQQVKIGAGKSGGNKEEEIRGNHSYNIKNNVKGTVWEDVDTIIKKNETRTINGFFKQDVIGDYTVISLDDVKIGAASNMSLNTISGITTIKSGSTLNIKSADAMTLKTETTLTETVLTNASRTVGGTLTDTVTGKGLITMAHEESEVTARAITLTQHTHTDPAGLSGAETSTSSN